MVLTSSPVRYPETSSSHQHESPRKRRKLDAGDRTREPLRDIANTRTTVNQLRGGFQDDSDSEADAEAPRLDLKLHTPLRPVDDVPTPPVSSPLHVPAHEEVPATSVGAEQGSQSSDGGSRSHLIPSKYTFTIRNASGKTRTILRKRDDTARHYSKQAEELSVTDPGKAQRNYYGIDIHCLLDTARKDMENRKTAAEEKAAAKASQASAEPVIETVETIRPDAKPHRTLLWTEKYRPRKFTDLVGDERTHRQVLRWLKGWDSIVFPGATTKTKKPIVANAAKEDERPLRKVLMLTGPPGLGKTTLAHVCAKQAGYEVQEINASDERSASVVKNRIRDMVATENVRSLDTSPDAATRKAGRPVCVVVDEVDGVVTGASNTGNGEGGFIKALVDLLHLDQKNCNPHTANNSARRKGDRFRLLRPIILICNDVYHPSLRLLRTGTISETIHVRKPAMTMVVPRLQAIFAREKVPADNDAVRQLCEAAWGVTSSKIDKTANAGVGEGDIRSILVIAEWAAAKLRASLTDGSQERLTKRWLATNLLQDLSHGGDASRSLGRGGTKEVVDRVFMHNAGFPASAPTATSGPHSTISASLQLTHTDLQKRAAFSRLAEMSASTGDQDRIMTDLFTSYPLHPYQDTTILTKPTHAYEWLHFHSLCSSAVHAHQTWEMAPYLSYPVLAFHNLFASPSKSQPQHNFEDATEVEAHPLTTQRAAYLASESTKANNATLTALHSSLSLPLQRLFRGPRDLATDLVPYLLRLLAPDVKPVVIGGQASVRRGAEKERLVRSAGAMVATGVRFEKIRIEDLSAAEGRQGGWAYRMTPGVDELGLYSTALNGKKDSGGGGAGGYGVRAALSSTCESEIRRLEHEARQRRAGNHDVSMQSAQLDDVNHTAPGPGKVVKIKRDFFGRPVKKVEPVLDVEALERGKEKGKVGSVTRGEGIKGNDEASGRVWVTFHEGYSNAVRKGIGMGELLGSL